MRRNEAELVEAIGVLTRATELAPKSFEAYFELATAYTTAKRKAEAAVPAARALELFDAANITPEMRDVVRATLEGWLREAEALNAVGPLPPPK